MSMVGLVDGGQDSNEWDGGQRWEWEGNGIQEVID
jgi:hypothetical protein